MDVTNRVKWLALVQDITGKEDKAKEKEMRTRAPETVGIGLMKIIRKEDESEAEEEVEDTLKRPFDVTYSWVAHLDIPRDSYDLMYRLGQKTEKYFETKVEYYAPYLLKDGMVQRMTQYATNAPDAEETRTFVKYRNRADRLIGKVVEKTEGKLTEKFDMGRPDRLEQLSYLRDTGGDEQETVKVYTFYHRSRKDGLATRESREWEITDTYIGREDCLVKMQVSFGLPDKKFGPAVDEEVTNRKILTIIESYSLPEGGVPQKSIAERFYDLEEETIKLKFHRERDRILCQTVQLYFIFLFCPAVFCVCILRLNHLPDG